MPRGGHRPPPHVIVTTPRGAPVKGAPLVAFGHTSNMTTTPRGVARPRARTAPAQPSHLEQAFAWQVSVAGLPAPVTELRFHPTRQWRLDFTWPDALVAVEVEGGVHSGGRHTRGTGFEADCEKYAEATLLGWTVLRVTGRHVASGQAVEWLRRLLERKLPGTHPPR